MIAPLPEQAVTIRSVQDVHPVYVTQMKVYANPCVQGRLIVQGAHVISIQVMQVLRSPVVGMIPVRSS